MHLPQQLAQVDPIVASFCGGAVGVLSTLMVVEARPRSFRCPACMNASPINCSAGEASITFQLHAICEVTAGGCAPGK